MNKQDILNELDRFFYSVLVHPDLIGELTRLIFNSGFEAKFFALLVTRLQQLAVYGVRAIILKEFELLGDGLYSMHLSGKGFNIRILYGFLKNNQPVLLLSFYERAGKSKTDYSSHIPVASERLLEFRKGFDHE